jgi:hypothetical protein
MLDVHPPEHTPHSWRDFFIHIATIVIGLLIAICLEQTVELINRHHEVKETREALAQEREQNRKFFAVNTAEFHEAVAAVKNNLRILLYLQQHPGTPEEKLPGILVWNDGYEPVVDSVWKNAQETQVLALFPRQEAEDDANLYRVLDTADANFKKMHESMTRARNYMFIDTDPSHMTPAQLTAEIELTQEILHQLAEWGNYLLLTHHYFPDFTNAPTQQDIGNLYGFPVTPSEAKKLAPAIAITNANLAKVHAEKNAALKAAGDTGN